MNKKELRISDILKILKKHILLITFMIFLAFLSASIYLYFTPSTYSVNASIEVITYDKGNRETNDLLQNTFYANKEVDKEIEKLTTYEINQQVINNMDLSTQYFIKDGYRKKEIYGDEVPIKVKNIKNLDDIILTRIIKFTPLKSGYKLEIEPTLQEKLTKLILKKEIFRLDNSKVLPYDKIIKTKYFEFSIKKISNVTEPIYLKLNGDTRYIYENLIKSKLFVGQKNRNAPIIDIVYNDNIPKRATEYVNRLIEIFKNEGRIEKSKRNNLISKFLKTELNKNSKELRDAEKDLERYRVKNKAIKISTQTDLIIKGLNNIEVSISDNHLKNIMIDNILDLISRGKRIDSIAPFLTDLKATVNISLIQSLQKLELEENRLSSEYTDEYPDLITIRKQIDITKDKIKSNLKNLKLSILAKKANLELLKLKKEKELNQLPVDETNMANLDRRYKLLLKMNEYLSQKEKENNTIKAAIISDYKIIERAYLPKVPIKPKRSFIQILAMLTGLVIGVILALLRNAFSDNIVNREDIEKYTTLEVSGVIPFSKKYKNRDIRVFQYPQSLFTESFRKLRTDLQFASSSNKSNIFLVTSMLPKAGKSTVLSNLSAIFQLAGYKTIVIDLDLRNPSLHKYFDIDYNVGMSEYLGGRADISDIVFPTAYPNLDIIPAGSIPNNPSELILSSRIEILLKKLKDKYDYIFIDSTSLGLSTDTLSLMKYSDINLVIVRKDYSKKSSISKLEKMIAKYNLKNIKLVINASKENEKY